jgi:2-oxoglutarate ferredoxin oxidoreductase subunit alpha
MFAKAIFRMGIPVSPKNIFPSNIQGLPTWYEVRVSEKGYLGRREGIDIMLSVNPQSMPKDIANVKPGGYFIYDSTKELYKDFIRDDIHYLGIPMICRSASTPVAQKHGVRRRTFCLAGYRAGGAARHHHPKIQRQGKAGNCQF